MTPEAKTISDRFRLLVEDAKRQGFQVKLVGD